MAILYETRKRKEKRSPGQNWGQEEVEGKNISNRFLNRKKKMTCVQAPKGERRKRLLVHGSSATNVGGGGSSAGKQRTNKKNNPGQPVIVTIRW